MPHLPGRQRHGWSTPCLYNGSTYLPVRAIGEIMGKRVGWNGATGTVTLTTPGGSLVTDADTFEPTGQPGQGAGQTGRITAEQAKAAALSHAGLTAEQCDLSSPASWTMTTGPAGLRRGVLHRRGAGVRL